MYNQTVGSSKPHPIVGSHNENVYDGYGVDYDYPNMHPKEDLVS